MDTVLLQQWKNALSTVMDTSEAEACFRTYLLWLSDNNLTLQENSMHEVIAKLLTHEPLQYILGEAWFYGMALRVNKHTLIPRPETEELCDIIIKNSPEKNLKILDVGTGSGCIPITLLKNKPRWKATALDIDTGALETASYNAVKQGVSDRITFLQIDFINGFNSSEKWELIVSNPPYIDWEEMKNMEQNVLKWEPHTALFPEGKDPLIFYKKIAELLMDQDKGCAVWAEINPVFADETLQIFNSYSIKKLIKDMSGKWRFIHIIK